eukprot:SAG22_NODE_899_length_6616_cov_2.845634_3_plen_475_part_00
MRWLQKLPVRVHLTRERMESPAGEALSRRVQGWASKNLVFRAGDTVTNRIPSAGEHAVVVAEVRSQFVADTRVPPRALEGNNGRWFYHGVQAAAKSQGYSGEIRAWSRTKHARAYNGRWAASCGPGCGEGGAEAAAAGDEDHGIKRAAAEAAPPSAADRHKRQRRQPAGPVPATDTSSNREDSDTEGGSDSDTEGSAEEKVGPADDGMSRLRLETREEVAPNPESFVGQSVWRFFPGYGWFEGVITQVISRSKDGRHKTFDCHYADGDSEHLSLSQLREILIPPPPMRTAASAPKGKKGVAAVFAGVGGTAAAAKLVGRELRLRASREGGRRPAARIVEVQPPAMGSGDDELYVVQTASERSSERRVTAAAASSAAEGAGTGSSTSGAGGGPDSPQPYTVVLTVWQVREGLQPTAAAIAAMRVRQAESYAKPLAALQRVASARAGAALQRACPRDLALAGLVCTSMRRQQAAEK